MKIIGKPIQINKIVHKLTKFSLVASDHYYTFF